MSDDEESRSSSQWEYSDDDDLETAVSTDDSLLEHKVAAVPSLLSSQSASITEQSIHLAIRSLPPSPPAPINDLPLIPEKSLEHADRLTLVLDLDEVPLRFPKLTPRPWCISLQSFDHSRFLNTR